MQAEPGTFRNGVHFFPVRVYFEDTDAGGIVYHANYLKFAERARTEMLRLGGQNQSLLMNDDDTPIAFVVRHCSIDYNKAARLDDLLIVETGVVRVGGARLLMKQDIRRQDDEVIIETEGRSFLHHQVRNMVGTLSLVGEGKWTKADFIAAKEALDRTKGGITAPACGLYLMRIDY